MHRKNRCRPQLENLESMTLLSGFSAGFHPAASAIVIAGASSTSTTPTLISLIGTLKGNYHLKPGIPDVGATYNFFGHGIVKPVGGADVTGHVDQLGFVASGHAKGVIVISTPQGSLTVKLQGPKQKGFAPLPDHFSATITNGSGSYLKDRGHGTLVLVLDPASAGADHGTFTMVLVKS